MRPNIGALIVEECVLDAEDVAGRIHRRADLVALLARMIGGDEVFLAILDPLHRPAEAHRGDAYQDILRIKFAAHAETATDMSFEQV
jgi:hypothetical protein